jgi:hypothetical protein
VGIIRKCLLFPKFEKLWLATRWCGRAGQQLQIKKIKFLTVLGLVNVKSVGGSRGVLCGPVHEQNESLS